MGIYKLASDIKKMAIMTPNVAMASFGDISLYDNKSIILYPYVNIDIINDIVDGNANCTYKFAIYVIDRNDEYEAYNKCELILDELMQKLQIENYNTNFIHKDFQDQVIGVYTELSYEDTIGLSCQYYEYGALITEEELPIDQYITTNNNKLISKEN
jgi:hypothetical protein